MSSITEYSLNTPIYNNNILNAKIIDMLKKENIMIGGSSSQNMSKCIILIVSIIIIIIGFYLCWNKNDLVNTIGQVQNVSCNLSDISSECTYNLTYIVNNIQYSKNIILDKNLVPQTNTIQIYYKESDPNIMYLYNYNFSIIGLILIIVGSFILISSL